MLAAAQDLVPARDRARVADALTALVDTDLPLPRRVDRALTLADLLWEHPVRELVTTGDTYSIWVDRKRALFSAWYEFFPARRARWEPVRHLRHRHRPAARVAAMGFDVLYLPPIHPIGRVNRKGPNNALTAGPTDVGSPWAIGAAEGGHDTIHPIWVRRQTSAPSSRRRRRRAWRWRWTWRCSARRTTPGSPSTRSGSPPGPTAASPTRRTRQRSTRTSTRSTSTTTRRASGPRCCGWCCTGSARASGSSGWTTRTPSRSTSGTG
ncbi:hypothetical protein NKG94_20010 [Micromonospora sp. M12]